MRKRLALILAVVFCLVAAVSFPTPVSAKDNWTSVRSKNFLLVGNASEKDIRQVGIRLEQFREVFSRLFTNLSVSSPVPTTVIVFKNEQSYRPFKPNANNAGYFQSGLDVNYITLMLARGMPSDQDPFTLIFHEYTHLLVNNTSSNAPLWLNEGLAEFYSTFNINDDQKVVIGRPIAAHAQLLRQNKMLPLRKLFQVDQKSPYYNESDKQSVFYAETWALMHYLILNKDGQRVAQLGKFRELIAARLALEQAFQQAFAMTFESMEKELRTYVQRDRYPVFSGGFTSKVGYDKEMKAAPITEAEAQAYLGDLLLKSNRDDDSEVYLQRALALEPDLAMAHASLGMLRLRQEKSETARQSLERALAAGSQNPLVHYYYAYALSREVERDVQEVIGYPPEMAAKMRQALKRAIQLRPDFPDSYRLLAFVNLVTETEIDETTELLKRALASSPERNDLIFMLAQLYLRKEDFQTTRQLIDKLNSRNDAEVRQLAQGLLKRLVLAEEQLADLSRENRHDLTELAPDGTRRVSIVGTYDPAAALRESLRRPATGETQTQGRLSRIDCDAKSITFVIKVDDRLLKLNTDGFEHVNLKSFSEDATGQLTCGPRQPENNVVVSYVPTTEQRPNTDGLVKTVEFVPQDFKLKP